MGPRDSDLGFYGEGEERSTFVDSEARDEDPCRLSLGGNIREYAYVELVARYVHTSIREPGQRGPQYYFLQHFKNCRSMPKLIITSSN